MNCQSQQRWADPRSVLVLGLMIVMSGELDAAEPTEEGFRFFESRVRPVLVDRCYECHSDDDAESELRLDSLAGMLRGGKRGPAIVLGRPKQSLIVRALSHGERLQMPPKTKLRPRQIADIAAWIKLGAPWPGASAKDIQRTTNERDALFSKEEKSFWAFHSPVASNLPGVQNKKWVQSPIDAFVLAQLEANGLSPARPADRRTLIRRVTLDLIGVPPTPDDVNAFLADDSPDAFAKVVDRLLASPHYGERWGRHWLDVARYGDSNGLDENLAFANAYRYRDYVVSSFNDDLSYDKFIHEQLAGDLLFDDVVARSPDRATGATEALIEKREFGRPSVGPTAGSGDTRRATDSRRTSALIATGFLALGAKMLAEDDPLKMQMDIIDEQVDLVGRAFMGLTLGCARCHDHKFDPIPTADYYSLAGIFKSTRTMENFSVVARWQERPLATPAAVQTQTEYKEKIAAKQAQIDQLKKDATSLVLHKARLHVGDYLLAAFQQQRLNESLTQAKVYGNDPEARSVAGLTIIEAEAFKRGNVHKDTTSYGKSIGVLVNQGQLPNFVEYDIDINAAGAYQLEVRHAAAGSRPCKLFINGKLVKSDVASKVTGSWFPDTQQWNVEGFFPLQKGNNVIRLEHPQHFPHIDKLLLVPAPAELREIQQAKLSADFQPIPPLVSQWGSYLAKVENDADSVFSIWHTFLDKQKVESIANDDVRKALVGTAKPTSIVGLARRYHDRFARAELAASKLKSSGDGEPATLDDPIDELFRQVLYDKEGPFAVSESIESYYPAPTVAKLKQLTAEHASLEKSLPKLPETMAVSDDKPQNLRIHIRGSYLTQGREVPRQMPQIIAGRQQSPLGADQSGRLELARWLTDPNHPLTARVMVNRIWQGHFGAGLVRTSDNFGRLGQRPTHPKLLDWLARRFIDSGWSIKSMHRTIMLSNTYQMATTWNEQAAHRDPENRLLWRMNRRRLEAEAIRDSMLAVSGKLERKMGGSLLPTPNRKYVTSTANVDPVVYESSRRSIYLPVVRSALYDVFQAFDFPDPSVLAATRQSTTVAPQALFMMNSKFVSEQTTSMATSLVGYKTMSDEDRVRMAYQSAYSRLPSDTELSGALKYVQRYSDARRSRDENEERRLRLAWQSLCRAILSANEFIYVD